MRLVNIRASDQGRAVLNVLNKFGTALQENALIVVETGRVRIRIAEAN